MCGIFGFLGSSPVDEKRFHQCVGLLHHRGPDSTGTKVWPRVAFGFTRLAIQDLTSTGNQPMSHSTEPFHIIYNGEIYNFKLLREELVKLGARFRSQTDTEVILHGYHKWGWEETLHRLEGMFAIALYDGKQEKVFLARDRFGQKPLFFSAGTNNVHLLFSSEIKSIIHYQGTAKLNFLNSLNPLFTTGLSPRGTTMFDGVHQLQEGSYLEYDLNAASIRQKKYFQLSDWVSKDQYHELNGYSEEKLLSVYRDALEKTIDQHLISDAPLASLFSAGLDSSLITAVAAKFRPISLYHYETELFNLLSYPRDFARRYGLELKVKKGEDRDFIYDLPRMIYHYETINKEDGVVLASLCRFARRDGIKVLLTGDASDELFGGQPYFVNFAIQNAFYRSKFWRGFMRVFNAVFPNNPTKRTNDNPLGTHYWLNPPGVNFCEVPLNLLYHKGERLQDWQSCIQAYDFLSNKNEQHLMAYMLDELDYRFQRYMIRSDRFGMMESVEIRTPLLHPPLVKLAVNTPTRWRMKKKMLARGYEKKYLVKKLALKTGLPHSLVYRKKITTPHNSQPQLLKIIERWPLTNVSEFLKIDSSTLRRTILGSYDIELSRTQFAFVSMEVLMRLFVQGDSIEQLTEEFRSVVGTEPTGSQKSESAKVCGVSN